MKRNIPALIAMAIFSLLVGCSQHEQLVGLDHIDKKKPIHFIYRSGETLYYTTLIHERSGMLILESNKQIPLELTNDSNRWQAELQALAKLRSSSFFHETNNVYIMPTDFTKVSLVNINLLCKEPYLKLQPINEGKDQVIGMFHANTRQFYIETMATEDFQNLATELQNLDFPQMSCASRRVGMYDATLINLTSENRKKACMVLDMNENNTDCFVVSEDEATYTSLPYSREELIKKVQQHFQVDYLAALAKLHRLEFPDMVSDGKPPMGKDSAAVSQIVKKDLLQLCDELKALRAQAQKEMKVPLTQDIFLAGPNSIYSFCPESIGVATDTGVEYLYPIPLHLRPSVDKKALANRAHEFAPIMGIAAELNAISPTRMTLQIY